MFHARRFDRVMNDSICCSTHVYINRKRCVPVVSIWSNMHAVYVQDVKYVLFCDALMTSFTLQFKMLIFISSKHWHQFPSSHKILLKLQHRFILKCRSVSKPSEIQFPCNRSPMQLSTALQSRVFVFRFHRKFSSTAKTSNMYICGFDSIYIIT